MDGILCESAQGQEEGALVFLYLEHLSQPLRQRERDLPDWWVRWKSGPTPKLGGLPSGRGMGCALWGKEEASIAMTTVLKLLSA